MITPHRRFAYGSLPLPDVKSVKQYFGGTVNDVVMAMCAGALRRWLIDHDALPTAPLLAMVPVSVRTDEQRGTFGNRVSAMIAELPTDSLPVERFHRCRRDVDREGTASRDSRDMPRTSRSSRRRPCSAWPAGLRLA
jgi:hypothetical protein